MSMSENNQLKPGQLISTPVSKSNSEFDKMFDGLGLGSYVSSKETAGSIGKYKKFHRKMAVTLTAFEVVFF